MTDHTHHVRYGTIDRDLLAALRTTAPEADGPFLMLNLMRYREVADYQEGRDEAPISGREADDRYAPLAILHEIGAEIVLFGEVVEQVRGDEGWDRVAIVAYPTMRSFLDMNDRPDFTARHVDKDAGMERTIIAACHGTPVGLAGAQELLVDLVWTDALPAGALTAQALVGDGRAWNALALTTGSDQLLESVRATTVRVRPLLNSL